MKNSLLRLRDLLEAVPYAFLALLLRLGARKAVLDGAPGLLLARSGLSAGVLEQWFIVRDPAVHLITLYRSPAWPRDSPFLRDDFARMLHSWRWTAQP